MKKRSLIIISILLFIVLGYLFIQLNKNYLDLWNMNSIEVTVDKPLESEKVKIELGFNSINRKNDLELFEERGRYQIFYDKENKYDKKIGYGENDFLITYDNKKYLSFRQFKINARAQHDYKFHFYEKGNTIFVQVDIKGLDGLKFERAMIDIEKAGKYRCNVPVEKAGILYNMIELVNPK